MSTFTILIILGMFGAYLTGSISFSYLAGKLIKGMDLRKFGSGNLGASNTFRMLGRTPGLIVLFLDILKGYLAVYTVCNIAVIYGINNKEQLMLIGVLAALSAILGHIFTIYHNFKGGKGIAVSLGVFLYLTPVSIIISFGVFLGFFLPSKYISLGSIAAAVSLPLAVLFQKYVLLQHIPNVLIYFTITVSLMVIVKHRANIGRLCSGTENKFQW